jgi:bacillolysin
MTYFNFQSLKSSFLLLILFLFAAPLIGAGTNGNNKSPKNLKKHREALRNNANPAPNSPRTSLRLRGRDIPVQHVNGAGTGQSIAAPLSSKPLFAGQNGAGLMGNFPTLPATLASGGLVVNSQYDPTYPNSTPIFIHLKGNESNPINTPDQDRNASALLQAHKQLLQIDNPTQEFSTLSLETDQLGITHLKLQQMYAGIPVWNKQLMVHYTAPNEAIINGRYVASPRNLSTMPYFTHETAIAAALGNLATKTKVRELNSFEQKILHYQQPISELVIYQPMNDQVPAQNNMAMPQASLAYHITIRPNLLERWEYFVNAHNGEIINSYNNTCTDGPNTANITDLNGQTQLVHTYQVSGTYYMIDASRPMYSAAASNLPDEPVGAIWCITANNTFLSNISHITSPNNSWTSPRAASAMSNGARAYEYYKNTHARNSLNGTNGTIISVINVTDENGDQMDNAFWNGQLMAYGNGLQLCDKPLAAGLDVAGHEMTHGVIENSSANLEYMGQSGALNESFADIFGCMIDRDDWTVGEDIINNAVIPSGVLRSMSNPHNGASSPSTFYWQPENMSEYQNLASNQDNGGVHVNSGIVNRAFYLYATAVTKDKAERVYYRALTQYLTSNSQFIDCRLAVIQAATELYGANSFEVQSARSAFDGVQIYGGTSENNNTGGTGGTTNNDDYPAVNGTDWLYVCDDAGSYVVNPTTGDFTALVNGAHLNNASIDDTGSIAFFVASDGNVYSTTLNVSGPTVEQWTNDGTWINVAVSRDGNKLALVDNSSTGHTLYIYNIPTDASYAFNLYNPSYSGTASGGVQYADALDWDFAGEVVMYDAYNSITNTSGSAITYWDINFINVWDNASNQAAGGEVEKLYSSLPDGVSIGNAIFSKNSPYIIAFDVLDQNQDIFYLLGGNIISGAEGEILSSNTVAGVPTYSKNDNQLGFTTTDSNNDDAVARISLAADKINSTGNPTLIVSGGKWGVWYTVGTRPNTGCVGFGVNITAQGSTQICNGSSVTLDAGAGYNTYAWSGGGNTRFKTVSTAGTFTVSVTQGTCNAVSPAITVGIRPAPTASFSHQINASDVQFSNNSLNADSYLWNFGDGTTSTEGNPYHHYSTVGNKTVTLTATSNCGNNVSSQTFNISIVGIENANNNAATLSVLPNPSKGQFMVNVAGLTQNADVLVWDISGKQVFKGVINSPNTNLAIDLNNNSKGVYFLQINTASGSITQKIVVQ